MSNRVQFTIAIPRSNRVHYLTEADVRVVLSRLPVETYTGLRFVHLNDRNLGRHPCAYVEPRRRGIALCALPRSVSLSSYLVSPRRSPRLFGASRGRQWPRIAVRRFMLYELRCSTKSAISS